MLLLAGVRTSFDAAPAVTVNVAEADVSPAALAVMVALPTVVAVKLVLALPPLGVIGDAGLNVPVTPLTANVIGLLALVTVLPLASWIVAV